MFLDVVFESLRFLGRDDLDACQLASKSFRNIVEGSTVLALRTITSVNLVSSTAHISLSRSSFCHLTDQAGLLV